MSKPTKEKSECCNRCDLLAEGRILDKLPHDKCSCHFKEVNFLQVGETIICGHCDIRFAKGTKQADELGFKCECKCHSPKEEEVRKEFWRECAEKFNPSQEWLFDLVLEFWLSKLSSQEKSITESLAREVEGLRKEIYSSSSLNAPLKSYNQALDSVLSLIHKK